MHVFGRDGDGGATGSLGHFLATDGSPGAPVGVDVERPHAVAVVGKRGSGKTHTLGVLAEALSSAAGVAPVVVDPMGDLRGLAAAGARVTEPTVRADAVPPASWPALLGLDPESGAGSLAWRAAAEATTLAGMRSFVADADADATARRAAANHLSLAAAWGVFAPDGLDAAALDRSRGTVLDCSRLGAAATNAVCLAVARGCYDRRRRGDGRLLWLLVDEAHVAFDGVAAGAMETLLARGRGPGVSLVLATQRPGALPAVAVSQTDLLLAHRLTADADRAALTAANAAFLDRDVRASLPTDRGCALVVDDATETAHRVRVRERRTPDGGDSPRASDVASGAASATARPAAEGRSRTEAGDEPRLRTESAE
jgi:hypothetical protein